LNEYEIATYVDDSARQRTTFMQEESLCLVAATTIRQLKEITKTKEGWFFLALYNRALPKGKPASRSSLDLAR